MKKHIAFIVSILLSVVAYSQDATIKKGAIGFGVSYLDFKKTNLTDGLTKGAPALGIQYLKGITTKFDVFVNLDIASLQYPYYVSLRVPAASTNNTYAALALNINYKLTTDNKKFVPFFTTGLGLATDHFSYYNAFVPLGAGIQIKAKHGSFVNLISTYRAEASTLTKMHYSHSIAYTLPLKGKDKKAIELPPAPIKVDNDDDGVSDTDDACPNQKGIVKYKGCPIPDTDKDGINDEQDQCPSTDGMERYKGCPIPDTDKDGINDEQDKCPTIKGLSRYNGCPIPDTDMDGVNDEEDNCPSIAGIAINKGCEDLQPIVNAATSNLRFATGSNRLTTQQTTPLNSLIQLMADHTSIQLVIAGHTDNIGSQKINDPLSISRAKVVLDYLSKKGIDAKRMSIKGFSFSQPIADNTSKKGRAMNRRVEILVLY